MHNISWVSICFYYILLLVKSVLAAITDKSLYIFGELILKMMSYILYLRCLCPTRRAIGHSLSDSGGNVVLPPHGWLTRWLVSLRHSGKCPPVDWQNWNTFGPSYNTGSILKLLFYTLIQMIFLEPSQKFPILVKIVIAIRRLSDSLLAIPISSILSKFHLCMFQIDRKW